MQVVSNVPFVKSVQQLDKGASVDERQLLWHRRHCAGDDEGSGRSKLQKVGTPLTTALKIKAAVGM